LPTKKALERREWQRLPLAVPVFIRGTDCAGRSFIEFSTALNISAGGALLLVRGRVLPASVSVKVEIPATPASAKVKARRTLDGKVVRVRKFSGWAVCATRFAHPLLQEGQTQPKE
jgi:hypothetical protein